MYAIHKRKPDIQPMTFTAPTTVEKRITKQPCLHLSLFSVATYHGTTCLPTCQADWSLLSWICLSSASVCFLVFSFPKTEQLISVRDLLYQLTLTEHFTDENRQIATVCSTPQQLGLSMLQMSLCKWQLALCVLALRYWVNYVLKIIAIPSIHYLVTPT